MDPQMPEMDTTGNPPAIKETRSLTTADEQPARFLPVDPQRVSIDELEPTWLRERTAQHRREHGAWWGRRPAAITLTFLVLAAVLLGWCGYLLHLTSGFMTTVVAAFLILFGAAVALFFLSEDSNRRAAEAMLARMRAQNKTPVLPLRAEYHPSRFPARTGESRIRERTGLPNLWIPMRYIDRFRSIDATCPYKQIVSRLCREPKYAPPWSRFASRTLYTPVAAPSALALFQILVILHVTIPALAIIAIGLLVVIFTARAHTRFARSIYAQRINEDWPCLECGYPLRTLQHTEGTIAHCPECGTSLTTLDICLASWPPPKTQKARWLQG